MGSPLFGAPSGDTQTRLMVVGGDRDGAAVSVVDGEGQRHVVAGHLSTVPRLQVGDRVLATHSDAGLVVLGRLRRSGELPAAHGLDAGDSVELCGGRELTLRCGDSVVHLCEGGLEIGGRQIYAFGRERVDLKGAVIELN
jgi:hypothetical protein